MKAVWVGLLSTYFAINLPEYMLWRELVIGRPGYTRPKSYNWQGLQRVERIWVLQTAPINSGLPGSSTTSEGFPAGVMGMAAAAGARASGPFAMPAAAVPCFELLTAVASEAEAATGAATDPAAAFMPSSLRGGPSQSR